MTNLIEFLKLLEFNPKEGTEDIWLKRYLNEYEISVVVSETLKESKINYGNKIKIHRSTTTNFSKPESFVILECVNRILEKGYFPENIELEKEWPLGHRTKGNLDILVLDNEKNSYLMIECKTFGKEYRKEKEKIFKDGGQLFSYLIQEKTTKYLCLYTSTINNENIIYENSIIRITSQIISSRNQQEAFEAWTPQVFETKGIFEKASRPYKIEFTGITKKDLKDLTADDGGYIFNRFAEILRRNVVSDKTNAFNKIFNLFLCKIVDEFERNDDEKTQFQWEENEKNEDVMLRLNDLYKRGMEKYLELKISAVSKVELDEALSMFNVESMKKEIEELFIKQKLYSGNEFAFKEVFDKKTFELNAIVAKEVVKLLENYRIKYSTKQQFLGDFFEKLLNTGIKQESGQFFTPIPITTFICKSIPIEKIITEKNKKREKFFLPYVIDYASGSGHFLTEVMDEINTYVIKIVDDWIKGGDIAKRNFNSQKNDYLWATEYIYGIEKDYRLAKTTKISTFLNGDGDANIICGDGLDNFESSTEYKGKLKITNDGIHNEQFDILIANPPYSVSGFKNTLKNGKKAFTLYDRLTEQSSEIECLFIERAEHLVKSEGCLGIILPVSILTNSGIYTNARNIIFRNFDIKAIVALGNNTFMATGTNTIVLFLKKRNKIIVANSEEVINQFFRNFKDLTCNSIENAFSKFVKKVYEDITFEEYINLLKGNFEEINKSFVYKLYKREFGNYSNDDRDKFLNFIIQNEKEKILCFVLTYNKKIILAKSGKGNAEKEFLGYEFSNRRGHEGIKIHKDESGKIISSLYSEDELYNNEKINSYILKIFNDNEIIEINAKLKNNLAVRNLNEVIDFYTGRFEYKIIFSLKKKHKIISKYPHNYLDENVSIIDNGTNAPQDNKYFVNGNYPFIRAGNLNFKDSYGYVIPNEDSFINDKAISECSLKKFLKDTIVFPKSGQSVNTNNIGKLKEESYVVNHLACIYDDNKMILNYLYYFLEDFKTSNLIRVISDYPSINISEIKKLLIPIPPPDILLKINEDMLNIENKQKAIVDFLLSSKNKIKTIFGRLFKEFEDKFERLDDISLMIKRGKSPKYGSSDLQIIKSGQVRGYSNFDFTEKYFARYGFNVEDRKLEKGDILVNSTGVGTAGRVNYFGLDGNYTVDSHITIIRPDSNKVFSKIILYSLAHIGFDILEEMAEGQSGQIELTTDKIANIKIPVPDKEKIQKKIIDEIEIIEKEINEKEEIYSEFLKEKSKILNSYLY